MHCCMLFQKTRPVPSKNEINPKSVYFCPNVMEKNGATCKVAMCSNCWNKSLIEREGSRSATSNKNKRKRVRKILTSM